MNFLELLIVALAVILGSLVKGTTGLGLPLTAVPVIVFVGVQDAVVIILRPRRRVTQLVREYRQELRFVRGLPSFAGLGDQTVMVPGFSSHQ